MPKINVYLPKELASWVSKSKNLNVSEVCQEALRREKAAIKAIKEVKGVDAKVIQRIRETKKDYENESFERGVEYGETWAKETATFLDLERMYQSALDPNDIMWPPMPSELNDDFEKAQEDQKSINGHVNFKKFRSGWVHGAHNVLEKVRPAI